MLCKNCWIYRQRLEGTQDQLSHLTQDCARMLGRRVKDPMIASRFREALNETLDNLEAQWRWLITEIGDRQCPEGNCLLIKE